MLDAADYQIQLVEAPSVPREEMKLAVRWKLKDLLDYSVDAATIDVADVPADRSGAARAHYVYAVSARNERVHARMKLFQDAKFPLEAIDVPEMAQRNIAHLFEENGRGVALLAFDDRGGLLTFTAGGELYMTRHTDITAAQLTEVRGDLRDQTLDRLVLELQRSLDHFDRQFSYVTVARLLLAPLAADIGLDRHLADNLDVPVYALDLTEVLEFPGAPELRDPTRQGYRLHIIGAALRDRPS
jgi:MSHA biogenesis protein MshI